MVGRSRGEMVVVSGSGEEMVVAGSGEEMVVASSGEEMVVAGSSGGEMDISGTTGQWLMDASERDQSDYQSIDHHLPTIHVHISFIPSSFTVMFVCSYTDYCLLFETFAFFSQLSREG